jgi:hypothetical protein
MLSVLKSAAYKIYHIKDKNKMIVLPVVFQPCSLYLSKFSFPVESGGCMYA